jgi:predicted Zn-dependent peptidase
MAFKGSKKYPTAMKISTLMDSLGSQQNAFTSKDHTGYWIKAPAKHIATVLDVISDMVLHSLLKTEEIEREKGVIVEEINMYEDQPGAKVEDLFEGLVYQSNPLARPIVGQKETVAGFNRQTFVDYLANHYCANNAVLIVAGGLESYDQEKLKSEIKDKLGEWKKADKANYRSYAIKQNKPQQLIFTKKTEQTHIILGYRSFSLFDSRRPILSVLGAILGGGMSSRLFYQVRERRGLCYYIGTGAELYQDTGSLNTRLGVGVDLKKIQEALAIIVDEHQKLKEQLVETKELQRAKELIKGHLLLSMEDSRNIASFYGGKLILQGEYEMVEELIKKVEEVSPEQIRQLAEELFNERSLNLAVVGPINKELIPGFPT